MAYTTIDDPSEYFTTTLYTGDGQANRTVTNSANAGDFQPDWLWIKGRSHARHHHIYDSSRGATKWLQSSNTDAEATQAEAGVNSFDSNGFTEDFESSNYGFNVNNETFVAWQWTANGGTTASNTDGSITSTVQANTDAGFSIVSFTGTGATTTVGHGLGVTPKFFIIKSRSTGNWWTYTMVIDGSLDYLQLETTNAKADSGLTAPTSSVFYVNSSVAPNTENIIAYCFKNIQGYSRIGKYVGMGGEDGTFVYTGFKPAWVMIKRTNAVGAWEIYDTKRALYGNSPSSKDLQADSTGAENASTIGNGIDILSNGFKPTTGTLYLNGAGSTYIYLAFAERPFVTSKGTPTTAR